MSLEIASNGYEPMAEYLADYADALHYGDVELPLMDDAALTTSEQVRLGKFLLKADAGGRMTQRHNRRLSKHDMRQLADEPTIQQGEQL